MNTIFNQLQKELDQGREVMLVTIIAEAGSAPRGAGSQMLVGREGQFLGTIGGGAVEKKSEAMAMELLAEKRSDTHEFLLHRNDKEDIGMVCGGGVTVLFQYIPGDSRIWAELAGKLLDQLAAKKPGWLIQRTDGGAPALLDEAGALLAGEAPAESCLNSRGNLLTAAYFSMPLPVGERAMIFGGGHCALALAPVLHSVGFRVTVMDCRPEFVSRERFPQAEQLICGDYSRLEDYLTLTEEDYAVVMTSGHAHDFTVEEQLLRQPMAYVGVIGSRAKTASVNQRLRERGVSEEVIQTVHAPIGTAIKAVTPEEIAISIAGEMIYERALRRERSGAAQSHGCPMH